MSYREDWFNANKPILFGKYFCMHCGKLYSKNEIEIDHRIPKRDGGTDDLWNLQPLCRHCNRSKRDRQSIWETLVTLLLATLHGDLFIALKSIAKRKAEDALGIHYTRAELEELDQEVEE